MDYFYVNIVFTLKMQILTCLKSLLARENLVKAKYAIPRL